MKIGVFGRNSSIAAAMACVVVLNVQAQMPGGNGPAGVSAALTKLFGNNTAFSAKGEMQVTDSTRHEIAFWPMDFSLLDKKIRVEIDLTRTRNKDMPAGTAATLRAMGMAQVVSIIRPDKGQVYVIYPDQRVILSMPLPKEDLEGSDKAPHVTKTELGRETVDGHPCIKNKAIVTDSAGHSVEATTWDATDLNNLPIQIETLEKDTLSTVRFKQVQFTKPSRDLFDPPSGFTQYDNPRDLQLGVMKKMMDNAPKK